MPLIIPGNSQASTGYTIDQSIRFNDDDSAYMSRTFSASNRKTLTFSCWVKRGNQGTNQNIFGPQTNNTGSGTYGVIRFNPQNELDIFDYTNGTTNWRLQSTQLLRDSSAWYHFVFSMDTSNAVSSERLRMYINGQRVTDFDVETYPSLNYEGQWNNNLSHEIGAIQRGSTNQYFDGYLAEIVFIDGQALDCNSFAEFNDSGIWIPKEYSGSYGTNGFKIDGRDSSDLGDDESGNGNDFTTYNLAAHDQVLDSPTNNFATFNPVMTNDSDFEFTQGNLTLDMNTNKSWYVGAGASVSVSSGKWYWESYWNGGDSYTIWGILDTEQLHVLAGSGSTVIYSLNFQGIQPNASGNNDIYGGGSGATIGNTGQAASPGGIWQFALDLDNNKMWLGYNGTFLNSGDPAAGTNETWSSTYITSSSYTPINLGYQISAHSVLTYNFGQDSTFAGAVSAGGNKDSNGIGNFKYSVPSGYKALCSKNIGS